MVFVSSKYIHGIHMESKYSCPECGFSVTISDMNNAVYALLMTCPECDTDVTAYETA